MMTLTAVSVRQRLLDAFEELGIETVGITGETQLRADLDIDSAELVEIVATLADGRAPDGKALKAVRTVADLVAFLERQ